VFVVVPSPGMRYVGGDKHLGSIDIVSNSQWSPDLVYMGGDKHMSSIISNLQLSPDLFCMGGKQPHKLYH
jgi:hypothetical protein